MVPSVDVGASVEVGVGSWVVVPSEEVGASVEVIGSTDVVSESGVVVGS